MRRSNCARRWVTAERAVIDWSQVDTVLLDMDGTLLDLRFDNWFWQELIPHHYGAENGMSPLDAWQTIKPRFEAVRGTIEWYCVDHWTRELRLDIAAIKRTALLKISYLPGAENFLQKLAVTGKRRVLVTNAHPTTLAIKNQQVGLLQHFDAWHSTRTYDTPKENAAFWPRLRDQEPFVPERTLFVDDSLGPLRAAERFGIGWLCAVRYPDSGLPVQDTAHFAFVDRVAELL